jgi:TusA-related sulfurtransferase/uncharacterized Fe-S cluster-containing radical SAM superfamily protein
VSTDVPTVPPTSFPAIARTVDGGDMDCGSGLLLLITRAMRRLAAGELLAIRSAEPSVVVDLPAWAAMVGNEVAVQHAETARGPWWFAVRKGSAPASVFSQGTRTPVGHRLWVYTNFDCNLACTYCCAESSPKAASRRIEPDVAASVFAEFASMGGREVFLTGGEPFMHPELGALVRAAEGFERTILTNAMIFGRGARRATLESLDRSVVLQVSLDSAGPDLHDRQRGAGSWARALDGITLAHSLGFRVKVAATMFDEDPEGVADLHGRLDREGIAREDRVIRPVAMEGFADSGMHVSLDSLEPEPTITSDGAWWHPVAVTNANMRIADSPQPLAEVFGVVEDILDVQGAAAATGREVFRCA